MTEIAEILSGQDIYDAERIAGKIPYLTSTSSNNGIGYFVGNKNKTLEKNCISVNRNGAVGYAFFHGYDALFGNDTRKLRLKNANKYVALFITLQITKQKDKYAYGYKMGTGRLKKQKIKLPVNEQGKPDYDYMEKFMRAKENELLKKYLAKKFVGRYNQLEG